MRRFEDVGNAGLLITGEGGAGEAHVPGAGRGIACLVMAEPAAR